MKLYIISVSIFVWKGPFSIEYALTLQIFFLLTVFTMHYIIRRLPPPPAKKRDRTTTNEWGKSCNLQLASVLAGRRSWRSLKYPGHNNTTRATQANLQLRCVTVINIRCLSSLLSPLKKHVWLGPNIFGLFYKKKHARVQEILS